MAWFKREKEGITTTTKDKKETPEGLWYKCPKCDHVAPTEDFEAILWVCEKCSYHEKISAADYFKVLFD
ncbi:MAG: acetyl-CoA carboxylase carboxyl transferase subunit beta, partial [Flavobacteriales bacterium]